MDVQYWLWFPTFERGHLSRQTGPFEPTLFHLESDASKIPPSLKYAQDVSVEAA